MSVKVRTLDFFVAKKHLHCDVPSPFSSVSFSTNLFNVPDPTQETPAASFVICKFSSESGSSHIFTAPSPFEAGAGGFIEGQRVSTEYPPESGFHGFAYLFLHGFVDLEDQLCAGCHSLLI